MRWTLTALPSTIAITDCPATLSDPRFGASYAALEAAAHQPGERNIVLQGKPHRVFTEAGGWSRPAVVLPLDRFLDIRVKFALRTWRALSNVPVGADPAGLSGQRRSRLIASLQALDGRQEGASYRDIANVLFAAGAISASSWKTHHLRDRVIRTVKLGSDLMQGDYRQLLLHPYRGRVPKALMRGGDLTPP